RTFSHHPTQLLDNLEGVLLGRTHNALYAVTVQTEPVPSRVFPITSDFKNDAFHRKLLCRSGGNADVSTDRPSDSRSSTVRRADSLSPSAVHRPCNALWSLRPAPLSISTCPQAPSANRE